MLKLTKLVARVGTFLLRVSPRAFCLIVDSLSLCKPALLAGTEERIRAETNPHLVRCTFASLRAHAFLIHIENSFRSVLVIKL